VLHEDLGRMWLIQRLELDETEKVKSISYSTSPYHHHFHLHFHLHFHFLLHILLHDPKKQIIKVLRITLMMIKDKLNGEEFADFFILNKRCLKKDSTSYCA
jgi:hypothetical protein